MDVFGARFEQIQVLSFVMVWCDKLFLFLHQLGEIVFVFLLWDRKPTCLLLAHHKGRTNFALYSVEAVHDVRKPDYSLRRLISPLVMDSAKDLRRISSFLLLR